MRNFRSCKYTHTHTHRHTPRHTPRHIGTHTYTEIHTQVQARVSFISTSSLMDVCLYFRYEAAKDEFEIATDSTESATIYAASDREAARDALDQFVGVFHLYTTAPKTLSPQATEGRSPRQDQQQQEQENQIADLEEATIDEHGSNLITTNYDPTTIPAEVREEVRRRVGQRVRELKRAVEDLEERAHAE